MEALAFLGHGLADVIGLCLTVCIISWCCNRFRRFPVAGGIALMWLGIIIIGGVIAYLEG